MIQVQSFCKAYGQEMAVEELSFQVSAGQVLGLIGPNGAGKTTTMRALAGIIPFSAGQLTIDGFDVASSPVQVKQRTAYVPDDPRLFDDLTVAQHFAFVASVYGVDNWQHDMHDLLERFELSGKLNSKAADLSRGMRQKLALGCAWLYRPAALLLDEPMTGLDPRGIRTLKRSLQQRAQAGAAVIISSHLLAMVEDICSHVLILKDGRQSFYGTIDELRQQFADSGQPVSLEEIFFRAVDHGLPLVDLSGSASPADGVTI
jgi:ABC-2 type transport system ATP-binding protein